MREIYFVVFQADVRPRVAAVGRLVDAVAVAHVVARVRFAGTDPDGVVVGGIDRHRADRARRLLVEDRIPRLCAVRRFPDAAARAPSSRAWDRWPTRQRPRRVLPPPPARSRASSCWKTAVRASACWRRRRRRRGRVSAARRRRRRAERVGFARLIATRLDSKRGTTTRRPSSSSSDEQNQLEARSSKISAFSCGLRAALDTSGRSHESHTIATTRSSHT